MPCAYELVRKLLCFVSGVRKNAQAFAAERQIDRGGDSFPNYSVPFYSVTERLKGPVRMQEGIGERFVFA